MGDAQAWRQKPDVIEVLRDSLRVGSVEPLALPRRLEKMHVDPSPGPRGVLRNPFQGLVVAPLRTDRTILHIESPVLMRLRNFFHLVNEMEFGSLIGNRRLHEGAIGGADMGQEILLITVDPGIAVQDRADERHPDADIRSGARNAFDLL